MSVIKMMPKKERDFLDESYQALVDDVVAIAKLAGYEVEENPRLKRGWRASLLLENGIRTILVDIQIPHKRKYIGHLNFTNLSRAKQLEERGQLDLHSDVEVLIYTSRATYPSFDDAAKSHNVAVVTTFEDKYAPAKLLIELNK